MMRLSRREFAKTVRDAVAEIPENFRPYLERLVIDVEDQPSRQVMAEMDIADPTELLGVYEGTPLSEGTLEAPVPAGDRVIIYQRNLESMCRSRAELVEEIRATVLHEIGHHFGLDEDDLDELGYG